MSKPNSSNVKQRQPAGPQLEHYQVILQPRVTEKGMFQSENLNQYTFEVNQYATKTQIKDAVEALFNVQVSGVSTQNKKGKPRRYRYRFGRTKSWKKAIVTLAPDSRIDFF